MTSNNDQKMILFSIYNETTANEKLYNEGKPRDYRLLSKMYIKVKR